MPRTYSSNFKEKTGSTSGEEPVHLIEITHAQLAQPVRLCNDTQDLTSNGNTFTALPFRIALPDDFARKSPEARLSIDNVGRELTQWLDGSNGGRGARVRIMQVMRNAPNVLELDITCDLLDVRQNVLEVSGRLGYENILDIPALPETYRPENTPGLF